MARHRVAVLFYLYAVRRHTYDGRITIGAVAVSCGRKRNKRIGRSGLCDRKPTFRTFSITVKHRIVVRGIAAPRARNLVLWK